MSKGKVRGSKGRRPPAADPGLGGDKIHKALAAAGVGSRREIEGWISHGRITVNGEPAHIGQRINPRDRVEVDGSRVKLSTDVVAQVLVLNKSGGVVCSRHDADGRPTVFDDLPNLRGGRWVGVGRLDMQTTGLLVLTNDGALAHKMMHPSTGLDREYAVRVNKELDEDTLQRLMDGVNVDGEILRFSDIRFYNGSEKNFWYHVVLMEGKNREVRRLFEAAGCLVSRLKRVRYGPIILPAWLKSGQWARLQNDDVKALYRLLGLRYQPPPAGRPGRRRAGEAKGTCLLPYPELNTLI